MRSKDVEAADLASAVSKAQTHLREAEQALQQVLTLHMHPSMR